MSELISRKVLVTRPDPGLSETMMLLQEKGWNPVACPVLRIQNVEPLPELEGEAIVITSAQALPALRYQAKERLLLTVGEKTARRARDAGFVNVVAARGKRDALVELCRTQGLRGHQVSFVCGRGWQGQPYSRSVAEQLGARWVEGYHVERMSSLDENAERALMRNEVEAALFYSSETVRSFLALCPPPLKARLKAVRAVCLSEDIAQQAQPDLWRDVVSGDPVLCMGSYCSG